MRQLDSANAPRWEWRTFGVGLSDIEAKIGLTLSQPLIFRRRSFATVGANLD